MRYLVGFLCVCALGAMPLVGCAETAGDGGTGGSAGTGGTAGGGGTAGDGGTGGAGGTVCTQHDECGDGEHCWYGEGCDRFGVCRKKPTLCLLVIGRPEVCGCDGQTYPSASCAEMHTGGVAYEGVCDCLVHAECDRPAEYCYKTEGCLLGGLCTEKPTFCGILPLPAPVCGCDSFTYESFCIAAMSGVSVKHEGRCIDLCIDNDDCFTPAEYCASDEGCDSKGACAPRPTICGIPPVPSHVCGCDGSTYESACFAAMAGVRVASDGLCP